jgi:hypothetical protein
MGGGGGGKKWYNNFVIISHKKYYKKMFEIAKSGYIIYICDCIVASRPRLRRKVIYIVIRSTSSRIIIYIRVNSTVDCVRSPSLRGASATTQSRDIAISGLLRFARNDSYVNPSFHAV